MGLENDFKKKLLLFLFYWTKRLQLYRVCFCMHTKQNVAIGTVANSLSENEVILLTLLISKRYIPYTDFLKIHDGTYPFMFSQDIYVDGLESDSKYVFQYVKNVEIHHAKITTKDAFGEAENVTIYDSELHGEYLGWYSKNLRLMNCHISREQPLCYAQDFILENCTFDPACDRAFEYSTLNADIRGQSLILRIRHLDES